MSRTTDCRGSFAKGRFVALPQEVHQYKFHNANDSRTRMDSQIEGLVTLARGQLLDLSFEQPRADLRSLRHFWFCGPSAADWVPWGHGSLRRRRFASEENPHHLRLKRPDNPAIRANGRRIRECVMVRHVGWSPRLRRRAWPSRARLLCRRGVGPDHRSDRAPTGERANR